MSLNYTIPSDNRELQPISRVRRLSVYYTIPSDNRELQLMRFAQFYKLIIPYQVITGNNNHLSALYDRARIIPYQVITGNYNTAARAVSTMLLYHTK